MFLYFAIRRAHLAIVTRHLRETLWGNILIYLLSIPKYIFRGDLFLNPAKFVVFIYKQIIIICLYCFKKVDIKIHNVLLLYYGFAVITHTAELTALLFES